MPPARLLQGFAATAVFLICWFLLIPSGYSPSGLTSRWHHDAPRRENLTLDVEILKRLDVPVKFSYERHCISVREKPGLKREPLIEVPTSLRSREGSVEITLDENFTPNQESQSMFPPCGSETTVNVPEFHSHAKTSTSSLMLGVATTLTRIEESLPTFSRWLSETGSPLLVLLVDQPNLDDKAEDVLRVYALAFELKIFLILEPYHSTFEADSEGLKNFGLATVLDKHKREETKWFGIIDDDTFFLSLPRMVEALEPYDPEKPWYIGALTEGHTRVSKEGFKAWGGAGFFVSPPLMQTLAEHSVQCIHLDKFFGDILWRDCIMEITSPTVQLTELRGLNQMDLWNDLSGWYEAGFSPILTVHHWKSWHFYPITLAHIVSEVAGPDSVLQRYLFDNNTVFTNGYSIAQYPTGLPDLNLVELTMTEDVNLERPPEVLEFHHSMGHTRPALELGKEKVQWKFEHAVSTPDGTVRQFYVKKSDSDYSIIEIDWR
ncbi:uncharacterized protein RCC_02406 [Ramularia collo-cygni]|uniref:Glycosyltransferase family 31 protein n=1 Tax=Ramularia collo-cygni TaxID=112498 RepID=A0A2D3UMJ0_9PEZI|nr:uncharacterized protein RCC_02406 [Ramularia collo-cygni]CZT16572.1 uncharacterized protein RCC_02406 [Ramularia collo-cygni]